MTSLVHVRVGTVAHGLPFLFIYIILLFMVDVCTVLVLYSTAVLNLATDLAQL